MGTLLGCVFGPSLGVGIIDFIALLLISSSGDWSGERVELLLCASHCASGNGALVARVEPGVDFETGVGYVVSRSSILALRFFDIGSDHVLNIGLGLECISDVVDRSTKNCEPPKDQVGDRPTFCLHAESPSVIAIVELDVEGWLYTVLSDEVSTKEDWCCSHFSCP